MATHTRFSGGGFERDSRALDSVRAAFGWLVVGPEPLSIDGREFPGLPSRPVPLNEVRDRLLRRNCPQRVRDAVWAELVARSRAEGGAWTVGCAGVALPALTRITATLCARFAGDPSDIHAAVLAGFLTELMHVDLGKPRIMLRLRWAAYRAGHGCVRDALDAPAPTGGGFESAAPPPPAGHPDFVLARAVAQGAITAAEAELIGTTRLEETPLATAAQVRGITYEAAKKTRRRAELRLAAYLREDARDATATGPHAGAVEDDIAVQVADAMAITAAARGVTPLSSSPSATRPGAGRRNKTRRQMSPQGPGSGVQGRGRTPAASPTTTRTDRPHKPTGPTPEVPRCA